MEWTEPLCKQQQHAQKPRQMSRTADEEGGKPAASHHWNIPT